MKVYLFVLSIFTLLTAAAQPSSAQNSKNMNSYSTDSTAIAGVLNRSYFKGIYEGDIQLLQTVYYDHTLLFGDVKGQPYFKTLTEYLDGVKNRQSPRDSGKPFSGSILAIEIINSIAVARVQVKMYDFNYFELLSFHKFDDKWLIVNKMISDVQQ